MLEDRGRSHMALISINTTDYFALASRSNSYLYVAVSVARYKEYLYPFAEELLHNKITHWVLCSLQFFFYGSSDNAFHCC
jgi:hypothetical protein